MPTIVQEYTSENGNHKVTITKYANRYTVESRVFDGVKWQIGTVSNHYKTIRGAEYGVALKILRLSPHKFSRTI